MIRVGSQRYWILIAAVAFLLTAPTPTVAVRQDVDNEFYLEGYLTWNNGEGRITWSDAASEDPGGPGADTAKDVYTSEPIPRTIHVNASRLMQLDLYTQGVPTGTLGTSCKNGMRIGADLRMPNRIVAGGVNRGDQVFRTAPNQGAGSMFPPAPEGYGVCRLRFGAEVGVLYQGTILTLRVTHGTSDSIFPLYGMAGDHRSVLRIPFFPQEELPYRYPSYAKGAPGLAETPTPPSVKELGSILNGLVHGGVALVVPAGLPRRQRPAITLLLLAILASTAFGGCVGGKGPTSAVNNDDSPVSIEPVYQPGNLSQTGFGSIAGQVRSSVNGQAIQGAYAGLLATNHATQTDRYGRFVFRDLQPGSYNLHVDRSGYQAFDGTVKVLGNLIATVNISLVPVEVTDPDPDQKPHLHDYWGEKAERVLMQDEDLGVENCSFGGSYDCNTLSVFRIPSPASASEYSSILPGTYEVDVTLDWDPAQMGDALAGLSVQANNDPSTGNWTPYLPRGPGEPFHIAATWEMEDPGHQHFSTWTFDIMGECPCTTVDPVVAQQRIADPALVPRYSVTVVIHKGVVGLEAAHGDLWGGRDAIQVVDQPSGEVLVWKAPNDDRDPATPLYQRGHWWDNAVKPSNLIPQGTSWVEVFANSSRDLFPSYDVQLRVKTAISGAPTATCWAYAAVQAGENCRSPDPGYVDMGTGTRTGRSTRWVVPVGPDDADPYYAVRSFWVFGVNPKEDVATAAAVTLDHRLGEEIAFAYAVVAHRGTEK